MAECQPDANHKCSLVLDTSQTAAIQYNYVSYYGHNGINKAIRAVKA